jgi:L-threonylcarbamoyladenylate synthase
MAVLIPLDDPGALDAAEAALRAGDAVVLPTDTVYGLAALPDHADQLYALKGRPDSVPVAVLVESIDQARTLVRVPAAAQRVADALWPGPLTLVLETLDGQSTLGVRCPAHQFVRDLARRVGALSTTSANRHGEVTPPTATEAAASLEGAVALVIDGGPCHGVASTVVDACDETLTILREGPISAEQVRVAALR